MNVWNKYCLACLTVNESFKYFLDENVSAETYWFCTSIQVIKDENAPKSLCDNCYGLILKYSEFKTKCLQSHKTLVNLSSAHKFGYQIELEDDSKSIKQETKSGYCDDTELCDNANFEEVIIDKRLKKLKRHLKSKVHHINVRKRFLYSCKLCNKKFGFCDRYEAHMMEHEGKVIPIHCLPCNKTFKNWSSLKRHKDVEHTTVTLESLKCKTCGKILKSQQTLRLHQKIHEERSLCVCDVCGKGFTTHVNLKLHMNTHEENRERQYTCEHCGKKFFTNSLLQSHISKRHKGKRFICQICSYPFTDKYNLVKHLLKHEGKKLYKCDICFKCYSTQSTLVEHKRIHSGERPYMCNYCPKNFLSRRMLNDHHRIHTGERPHKCSVCEQAFTQRGTLKRHMKVHEKTVQATK